MNCDTNPLEAGLEYFVKLNKVCPIIFKMFHYVRSYPSQYLKRKNVIICKIKQVLEDELSNIFLQYIVLSTDLNIYIFKYKYTYMCIMVRSVHQTNDFLNVNMLSFV